MVSLESYFYLKNKLCFEPKIFMNCKGKQLKLEFSNIFCILGYFSSQQISLCGELNILRVTRKSHPVVIKSCTSPEHLK